MLVAVLIRKTVGISPVFEFKIHVTPFFDFKSPFLVLQLPRAEREHDTHGILSKCYPEPSEGFSSSKPDEIRNHQGMFPCREFPEAAQC